jgi:hypothetical protein
MSTKTKKYKVSQKITIFVEAKTKEEAIDKVVADDGNFEGWDWVAEECDDIIDFYPPVEDGKKKCSPCGGSGNILVWEVEDGESMGRRTYFRWRMG